METFEEIINKACQEPTFLDALTYVCICESERIVKQVTTNYGSGRDGAGWDTCFKIYLKEILIRYNKDEETIKQLRNDFAEVSETLLNNKTIYFKVKEERDQWKGRFEEVEKDWENSIKLLDKIWHCMNDDNLLDFPMYEIEEMLNFPKNLPEEKG